MTFFENIAGFLFRPYSQCRDLLSEEHFENYFKKSLLFVLYSSVVLGIIFIFWILCPEVLYYGVSFDKEYRQLLFINLSSPTNLLIFFGIGFFLFMIYHFFITGLINYFIGKALSRKEFKGRRWKEYLTVYGYASTLPILLFGVFAIFWIYFFEKLYIATEISPFIDFTLPIIIFFIIFLGFLTWKWLIEARVNQAFFRISLIRAGIPELVQVVGLVGFILLLDFIIGSFATTLDVV